MKILSFYERILLLAERKKAKQFIITTGAMLSFVCLGQTAPPNDYFTNRIVLTGNDVMFDGTLEGATRETSPYEVQPPGLSTSPTQTVWWSWTPAQTTTAVFLIQNSSKAVDTTDGVGIYTLENIYTGQYEAGMKIDTHWPHIFFTFHAEAGTNYSIQLAGSDGASFSMRLIATNLPYIIEQPITQTISVNDGVLLTVVATGRKPFGYQWQFHGTNLPGETAPILALTHVSTNQAGDYRVAITNSAGTTMSDTANLFVTLTDTAPILKDVPSANEATFAFGLLGEVGRRYRIESSEDLADWAAATSFPYIFTPPHLFQAPFRSVVFDSTGTNIFTVPRSGLNKFFRAATYHASNEECNNTLMHLRCAQLLFGLDHQSNRFDPVTDDDLRGYFKNGEIPFCPTGGTYSLTILLVDPQCSRILSQGHVLEEP